MKNLLHISEQEKKNILRMHGILNEQDRPQDWSDDLHCVWLHSDAEPLKLKNGTTAFRLGEYIYYNNGRRKKNESGSSMENYTCDDVDFTKTTEDSSSQSSPEPKEVNMQYKDEKGPDKNYRYLKKGNDWFARNITKNGQVFNLSQKSKENSGKYQSSIDNLEKASTNRDGKSLDVDLNIK